jgi:hypothetical protein
MSGLPRTSAAVGATTATSSQVKDTARGQLNQIVGKLVENSTGQTDDIVTALQAIAAAINAKPSA